MNTKLLARAGILAAFICVLAPWSIPVGPVPVTLATFAVCLTAAVAGKRIGTLAVAIYLLIGCMGMPVFSGFSGGVQKLAGVTGGYLAGYLPMAFIIGAAADRFGERKRVYPLAMAAGTLVMYTLGTLWFMAVSGNGVSSSIAICVLPFIPGDAAKIALASMTAQPLRRALKNEHKNKV